MINSAENYPVSSLLSIDEKLIYRIPRYQREYTWGKWQWDALIDDLLENSDKYFLGSIICIVDNKDALAVRYLELVDGQQRLTTLSLLMAAIYYSYNNLGLDLSFEQKLDLHNLKHKLILKSQPNETRLIPQVQNLNQQDYFWVLKEAGILVDVDYPSNAGNRRVVKAFRHFCSRIEEYVNEQVEKQKDPIDALGVLIEKVNTATMIKIEVDSHSNAYTLFESLNNRGMPLTAVDLIKNKLLAKLESVDLGSIDQHFTNWMKVLNNLGDDYAVQERYFRQYYNAFKPKLTDIVSVSVATKSNLIHIYEKLIAHNAGKFLDQMIRHSAIYSQIICRSHVPEQPRLSNLLQDLERVQGVPSYLLLMFMLARKDELGLEFSDLEVVTKGLIAFFVRRNTTDKPATRDLTRIFMDITNQVFEKQITGDEIVEVINTKLSKVSADDSTFEKGLSGSIYEDNKGLCRFVLCAIEQSQMTRETERDLWAVNAKAKQFIWTIEHIFPQGENIPAAWIEMMADGDVSMAKEYLESHVHKLGNLTITGYNSSLGTKIFLDKRDRLDNKGNPVGFKNGLYLNQKLSTSESWSIQKIDERTQQLVNYILKMYPLPPKN